MSIAFAGKQGATEIRWIVWALLRDNVQHHLEGGQETNAFRLLHSVSAAFRGDVVSLPAAPFNRELRTIQDALRRLPVDQLAMTSRTRSVISYQWPAAPITTSEVVGPLAEFGTLVTNAATVGDVFEGTLDGLCAMTRDAGPDERIEIFDS
jgi:hypothetical protein